VQNLFDERMYLLCDRGDDLLEIYGIHK
jgi:hypothetical protein